MPQTTWIQFILILLGTVVFGIPLSAKAIGGFSNINTLPAEWFDIGRYGWPTIIALAVSSVFSFFTSMIFNFLALWIFSRVTSGSAAALAGVYIFYTCASLISVLMVAFMYKPELEAVQAEAKRAAEAAPHKKASTKEILAVLKMPKVWLFSLMVMGIYGFYAGSSYLTPYFSTVLGVSIVFSGSLATLKNYGTRLVGAPIAGHICDKIGRLKFLVIAAAATVVLMIIFMMMPANNSALIPIMILMFAMNRIRFRETPRSAPLMRSRLGKNQAMTPITRNSIKMSPKKPRISRLERDGWMLTTELRMVPTNSTLRTSLLRCRLASGPVTPTLAQR